MENERRRGKERGDEGVVLAFVSYSMVTFWFGLALVLADVDVLSCLMFHSIHYYVSVTLSPCALLLRFQTVYSPAMTLREVPW